VEARSLRGPVPIVVTGTTSGHQDDIDWWVAFPNPTPTPECWRDWIGTSNLQGADVFWNWNVPATGTYTFSTCPTAWDISLVIFNSTGVDSPTVHDVICGGEDGGPERCAFNPFAAVVDTLSLVQGQRILIDVDGFGPADSGAFILSITQP
jgi:hypothetical protein